MCASEAQHPARAQRAAQRVVLDGSATPHTSRIARLGAGGRYPGNAQRDLERYAFRFFNQFGVCLPLLYIDAFLLREMGRREWFDKNVCEMRLPLPERADTSCKRFWRA
eukprot:8991572-Alexandrium_andersonii.AAC.1